MLKDQKDVECIIIQLHKLKENKRNNNISHGLDDLLIKFLKKLYNSIYVNNTNKKMMNNIGVIVITNFGQDLLRDIDNADGVLKTYQN